MSRMETMLCDFDVVTRRVNHPSSSLRRVVGLLPPTIGPLRIDQPFTTVGRDLFRSWRARGRLYGHGVRLARYTRVEIEFTPWSEHVSQLRLRPVTRRLATWGRRRQRRYFQLAQRSADDLVRSLDVALHRQDASQLPRAILDEPTVGWLKPTLRSVGRSS